MKRLSTAAALVLSLSSVAHGEADQNPVDKKSLAESDEYHNPVDQKTYVAPGGWSTYAPSGGKQLAPLRVSGEVKFQFNLKVQP